MKFGCCTSLWDDTLLSLPAAGADYGEASFSSLADKSFDQVKARAKELKSAGVALEAMNVLFPGNLPLTGPKADFSQVDRYLEENLPKAALLGVKTLVFGSGGSRRVPEGFSKEEAFRQLVEVCREHIAPPVERAGMVCCVEPLWRGECNILNTTGEVGKLVREVNRTGLKMLVDLYHFHRQGEAYEDLLPNGAWIGHLHIASVQNDRHIPLPGDGEDYRGFFSLLHQLGYQGCLSLEGQITGGIPQISQSLTYLRELAQEAGL